MDYGIRGVVGACATAVHYSICLWPVLYVHLHLHPKLLLGFGPLTVDSKGSQLVGIAYYTTIHIILVYDLASMSYSKRLNWRWRWAFTVSSGHEGRNWSLHFSLTSIHYYVQYSKSMHHVCAPRLTVTKG
jgi:hypothetical protein